MISKIKLDQTKPLEVKPLNNSQTVTEQRTDVDVDVDLHMYFTMLDLYLQFITLLYTSNEMDSVLSF